MKLAERKAQVLQGKTKDQLLDELRQLKKEQFNLRFQKANSAVKDSSRVKWVRRKLALVKTMLQQQQQSS
jgi:large subunit ribosomal protein L29